MGGGRASKDFDTVVPPAFNPGRRRAGDRSALDFDGVAQVSDAVTLVVRASRTESDLNEVDPVYQFIGAEYLTKSASAELTADTSFGLLQATAYRNWLDVDDPKVPLFGSFFFNNDLTVVRLRDIFKAGTAHTFRFEGEYRHTNQFTTPFSGGEVSYDIAALSGTWDWTISPAVSFTNALRIDKLALGRKGAVPSGYPFTNADWNRSSTQVSFNSGAVWDMAEAGTLRATAARGVQVPSLAFSGGFLGVTPVGTFSGVPTLRPTIVANYEIGWDRAVPAMNARLHMGVFHQNSSDIISIQAGLIFTPAGPVFTQANVGHSHSNGAEFNVRGTVGDAWRWGAGLRYVSLEDHFDPAAANSQAFTDFEHTAPRYLANANLGWSEGRWEVDGFVRFESPRSGLQSTPAGSSVLVHLPAHVSLDGRIAYKILKGVSLAVSGQNLLQPTQRQTSGPLVERRVFGTLRYDF
ncbi:MAG: TonB-dependent receptor plug domain-containing protein [Rhodospirillaceae bacterium]